MKHSSFVSPSLVCAVLLLLVWSSVSVAQSGHVRGKVKDALSGESLPGVSILLPDGSGAATDDKGNYSIRLSQGELTITYSFIGYKNEKVTVQINKDETVVRDVSLRPVPVELNPAVISASRYEQRLSDVTVSMEVIPSNYIKSINTTQLDKTISLMPGVDVIDGQANIRGGGGFSYGAGSRVQVLIDELPMLSGDVNDVKWDALPIEIIDQVEIIKGASSALYGSSALNGVINLRTASPGIKPATNITVSSGMYMKPKRDELTWWWDHNPLIGNLQFSHLRKAGPFDISIGGSGMYDEGYRKDNYLKYGRMNAGLRFNSRKVKGLSAGLNTNYQLQSLADFIVWQNADSGAFLQNPDAFTPMKGSRLNIDPYITYFDGLNGKHSLKTRYYRVNNKFEEDADKNNGSDYFYGEYQFHKKFKNNLHWSIGAAGSYTKGTSNLYGNHSGSTMAVYSQFDRKFFEKLSASLGLRWERYTLDRTDDESKPVMRLGLNYELSKLTFVRASFGQGFRYPSMAEKYTSTGLASVKIFPNPVLKPETGWNTELGIRQGILLGKWSGFLDVSGFWTEYNNMMEFIFGLYNPDSVAPTIDYIGFKSINTGKARINGVDISLTGQGQAGPLKMKFFAGYTYMNPIDLSRDAQGPDTLENQILKYRYRHAAKGDMGVQYKNFDTGITMVYNSFMERIDAAFEEKILGRYFFPGLKAYRQKNNKGYMFMDFRFGWQMTTTSKINLQVKNLLNKEYMGRPGDIQPPRSVNLQYVLKII